MVDSGTSTYITPHKSVFINFRQCVLPVSTATGDVFYTEGYRDIILRITNKQSDDLIGSLTLYKVQLALDLKASLISMSALDKEDIGIQVKNGLITFKLQDQHTSSESVVGFATYEGEHYWLNCSGINKVDAILDCNLVSGSPNSVFAIKKGSSPTPISVNLAHRRAYYAGENRVRKMEVHSNRIKLKKGAGITFPYTLCIKGKGHTLPFGKERSIRSKPSDLIHLDVQGPISIASYGGERYFITFTDDASRFTWLFLLQSRSQVTETYIQLENHLKTQFGFTIKKVHSDDATEHKPLATYLASKGTVWDPTPPYTKQLNSVAEIKNRHLVEPLVAVMTEYQLPKYLWGYLLGGINYTMNRLYASKIEMLPYEALYGRKPDLSNLRTLGCQYWFLIPKEKRPTKLDPYMEEARLIAYDEGDNYVLYNVRTKKIERSRIVIFNENPSLEALPNPLYDLNLLSQGDQIDLQSSSSSPSDRHVPIDFVRPYLDNPFGVLSSSLPSPSVEDNINDTILTPANPPLDPSNPSILEYRVPEIESVSLLIIEVPLPDPDTFDLPDDDDKVEIAGSLGRFMEAQREDDGPYLDVGGAGVLVEPQLASRQVVNEDLPQGIQIDFTHLDPIPDDSPDTDYITTITQHPSDGTVRRSTRSKKPSQAYIKSLASRSFFDSNVLQLLADTPEVLINLFSAATLKEPQYTSSKLTVNDVGFEPNGWKEAMICVEKDKWLTAAYKELTRQIKNGTQRRIPRSSAKNRRKPLSLRWVFKIKYDGTYKARLVARGFRQIKDLDFYEVYTIVAKPISFKIFVAITAAKGWPIHHVDIVTAFLYAELKEPIEIELPKGQRELYPDDISLLIKTIYRLKQSPREQYRLLHDVLISMGFTRTQSDHSIFIKCTSGKAPLFIIIYVDDLLVLSPSE